MVNCIQGWLSLRSWQINSWWRSIHAGVRQGPLIQPQNLQPDSDKGTCLFPRLGSGYLHLWDHNRQRRKNHTQHQPLERCDSETSQFLIKKNVQTKQHVCGHQRVYFCIMLWRAETFYNLHLNSATAVSSDPQRLRSPVKESRFNLHRRLKRLHLRCVGACVRASYAGKTGVRHHEEVGSSLGGSCSVGARCWSALCRGRCSDCDCKQTRGSFSSEKTNKSCPFLTDLLDIHHLQWLSRKIPDKEATAQHLYWNYGLYIDMKYFEHTNPFQDQHSSSSI